MIILIVYFIFSVKLKITKVLNLQATTGYLIFIEWKQIRRNHGDQ